MSSQGSWTSTKDFSRKEEFPGRISNYTLRKRVFIKKYKMLTLIFREVFTGFVVFSSYAVAITCVTPVRKVLKIRGGGLLK